MLALSTKMSVPQHSSDPLAKIRQNFLVIVQADAKEIGVLLQASERPSERRQALSGVARIAHRVSGVAATLGFRDLGQIAAELDSMLSLALKSGPLEAQEFDTGITLFHAALHDALAESAT